MLESCSSRIRVDGKISIIEVNSLGSVFFMTKNVLQRSPRLGLVVQLDLVMCKNYPGGTGFECMKLSYRAGEA